ncbi:MAG: hypothetical protein WCQ64_01145 [Acidobacteriota bacterium]
MSEERFDRIEEKLTGHDARFDRVDLRADSLAMEMRRGFEAVNHRLGVLHEDLLNKIAASTERNAVSRQEFKEAMADMIEKFGRRVDPLEITVRRHSADFAKLKRAR